MNFYLRVILSSLVIALWEQIIGSYSGVYAQEVDSIDLQEEVTRTVEKELNQVVSEQLNDLSQPFINFAAIVKEGEELITISGELQLTPGELLQEVNVTLDLDVFDQVDPRDDQFQANQQLNIDNTAVAINFDLKENDELDTAIETAIADLGTNPNPSDVISLVELFVGEIREQAQPRVTVAAGKQDNNENVNSAIITEVELAPGQRFTNDANNDDAPMFIAVGVDNNTGVLNQLSIARDGEIIASNDDNINLEATVANAVSNTIFNQASELVSLVQAFGNGVDYGQARVSGAAAVEDNNPVNPIRTAVVGEVQLALGQLLTTTVNNNTETLVTVLASINDNINGENNVGIDGLNIQYQIADESNNLQSAIAQAVNGFTFEATSDIVSLVNAFVSGQKEEKFPNNQPDLLGIALD